MQKTPIPYCSLSDVKLALARDLNDSVDDTFLSALIPQAQAIIDNELGYAFQSETATKQFDGSGKQKLFIGEVIEVTSVIETIYPYIPTIYGTPWPLHPSTFHITADCVLGPSSSPVKFQLLRKSAEKFSPGVQNYSVTGTFGFASVPLDITRACIRLVCQMYKMRDTNYSDMMMEVGNVIQKFNKSIPADVQTILENYEHTNFYG